MKVHVDVKGVDQLIKKLEGISRGAMPTAVRNTLNTLAFETKKDIPVFADQAFTVRSKSFFKAFSSVKKAQGFNLKTMHSKAGMTGGKFGRGSSEQAGRDMVQQQLSGKIGGRTLIPMKTARTSNSDAKMVRKEFRVSNVKNVLDTASSTGISRKQRFVRTAVEAVKRGSDGGFIMHADAGGRVIYRVKRGRGVRKIKTREGTIGVTPIYSVVPGRQVSVAASPFVRRAAIKNHRQTFRIFEQQAKRRFK